MPITVTKIRKKGTSTWYTLPTPFAIQGGAQVLDSSESGRDNNTGYMHRNVVRDDVAEYSITLPFGLTNREIADISDIILSPSFEMYMPDTRYGGFPGQTVQINGVNKTVPTREFYCPSFEPQISPGTMTENPPYWEYEEYTFKAVEI